MTERDRAASTADEWATVERLIDGTYKPWDTPEDARELLQTVERMERHQRELRWAEEDAEAFERSPAGRARVHRVKADEIRSMRAKLKHSAKGYAERAAALSVGRETERLSDDQYKAFRNATAQLATVDEVDGKLAKIQRRHTQAVKAAVTNEPPAFGPNSQHSWFVDRAVMADPEAAAMAAAYGGFGDLNPAAVEERLRRHAQDVRRDYLKQGKRARYIERVIHERCRHDDPAIHQQRIREEKRALLTGGGATASAAGGGGAALVAPYFIFEAWAPFRGIHRTFADQCAKWPMPEYGMELYVPYFSTTDAVALQNEGTGVTETDPVAGLQNGQVQTVTGQLTLSQQFRDRGIEGGGGALDELLGRQLQQQLDEKLNLYVVNQVIAAGTAVAGAATWANVGTLYTDIAAGREKLTDTAGVRLRPTHFFSTGDFYSYVTRQVDSSGRPIVVPQFAPGFPLVQGADEPAGRTAKWSRFTGTVLPGSVLWFEDDTIPASGSNAQLIVSAPEEAVVLAEGEPILSVFPESSLAGNLEVILNLRQYVSAITRHASGTSVIAGAAYPSSLV